MQNILLMVLGACVGSFIEVWVSDFLSGERRSFERSRCDACRRKLSMAELIPIVSYCCQRGRCRRCGESIHRRVVWIEIIGAVLFAWVIYCGKMESAGQLGLMLVMVSVLLAMSWCDIRSGWVPDRLQVLFGVCGIAYRMLFMSDSHWEWGALWVVVVLYALYMIFHRSIGGADVKLLMLLAIILPLNCYPVCLLLASSFGLAHIGHQRWLEVSQPLIPFIPSIALAFYVVMTL